MCPDKPYFIRSMTRTDYYLVKHPNSNPKAEAYYSLEHDPKDPVICDEQEGRRFIKFLNSKEPLELVLIEDVLEIKSWTETNAPVGKRLGYPDCCIRAFCAQPPGILAKTQRTEADVDRYNAGCINGEFTGFIPCHKHAREILAGKITLQSLIRVYIVFAALRCRFR